MACVNRNLTILVNIIQSKNERYSRVTPENLLVRSNNRSMTGASANISAASLHGDAVPPSRWSWIFSTQGELAFAGVSGVLLVAGLGLRWADQPAFAHGVWAASLAIGLVHGGGAAAAALRARQFDIDVLMVIGAVLAAGVGAVWEGALLLFLFVLSGALEGLADAKTTRAVEALHRLMPTRALRRISPDRDEWTEVAPESLVPRDEIKILPGEAVPVDARVLEGRSSIDQSTLTGESVPRVVTSGDELFAGTINVGDPLRAVVTRPARESSLQRILNLVTKAREQRQPVQRAIDRLSQPYAIGVFVFSLAIFAIWWWYFKDPFKDALYAAITLLIVASPCAVIIATPTATLAAIARGARGGVLFKGGQSIERLSRLRAVAFDKTGTLTIGKMTVNQVHPVGWSDESRLLAVAAALEQDSTHPIAVAIRAYAANIGVAPLLAEKPGFVAGRGVQATFDGIPARLGTFIFTKELIPECLRARVQEVLLSVQRQGQIATVIAWNEQAGVIILSDSVRPGAVELVADLHALNVRPVVMLTGDNRATAAAVASALHLDRFEAELLPPDKVAHVQSLKKDAHGGVGVIGDGVNDAPALAASDVSMAIGSIGSDAALENADIVLLADDLRAVPWALRLARRARSTIAFNLTIAIAAIVLMAIATLVGSRTGSPLPLWSGVLGHEGGTLIVVLNSLLLLAFPLPKGLSPVSEHSQAS